MLTLLHEVHFWTQKDVVFIKDTDFGAFKYYDKKVDPQSLFFEGKKTYMLKRGMMTVLPNKRPNKLREALKELEEILCHNRIVVCDWKNTNHLQIIIATGLKINIRVDQETADITEICYDKFMIGKLSSQYLSDVGFSAKQAVFAYTDNKVTLVSFSNCKNVFDIEKKWSNLDPKLRVVELAGPAGRRVNRQVSFNCDGSMLLVWWKCSGDEVYPWSPTVKDEDRANVHVYSMELMRLECYIRTEYDPVYITFSSRKPDVLHSVQQRITCLGEVTLEWSIIEISRGRPETTYIISLLLPTHACVVALSPKEDNIFIGCIDGSVLIADNANNITDMKKAYFIPSLASWHPDSSLILISNERGQMQWFDRALFSVKSQLLNEESTPTSILDLGSYFKYQPTLLSTCWNRRASSTNEGKDDLVLLRFERGPLVIVKLSCSSLSPYTVVSQYLSMSCADRAVSLLLTMDWVGDSEAALECLQAIITHLLRFPLTPDRQGLLERALGSFYTPKTPLPESVLNEVADSVHDLSRRFFHQLLRYQIIDKAFSLAIDLADYDLFMDLHNYGKITGNPELALAALHKAEEVGYSDSSSSSSSCECTDSSCSCCSDEDTRRRLSPPPLPVLPPPKAKVKFANTVTRIPLPRQRERRLDGNVLCHVELPDISHNTVGLPCVDYLPQTFSQRLRLDQPSTSSLSSSIPSNAKNNGNSEEVEGGKIKVVHFGLV